MVKTLDYSQSSLRDGCGEHQFRWKRFGLFKPRESQLNMFRIQFDAHKSSLPSDCGHTCRRASQKWIEHPIVLLS